MLSRVAHNLYWMSRYLERAEHTARLLDVTLRQMLDSTPAAQPWEALLASLRAQPLAAMGADRYALAQALTFDRGNIASIANCVGQARDNARQVREWISSEMWEQLNRLFLAVTWANAEEAAHAEPYEFYKMVKEGAHLFQGITDGTMSHGEGWHFIQVGRYLERSLATATLLDVHLTPYVSSGREEQGPPLTLQWAGLLKSCTAFEAYCKVYTATMQPRNILEFLLLNPEFPRSIRFMAGAVQGSLQALGRSTGNRGGGRAERLAGRLCAALDYVQVEEIVADGVHDHLADIERLCTGIHTALYQTYILQQDVSGRRRWVDHGTGTQEAVTGPPRAEEAAGRFMQEPQ